MDNDFESYESVIDTLDKDALNKEFQLIKKLRTEGYDILHWEWKIEKKEKWFRLIVETNKKIDIILTKMKRNIFKPDYESIFPKLP